LDLKSFLAFEGWVYCKTHVPKVKAHSVADDVMTQHIKNAPKKVSEGTGHVSKTNKAGSGASADARVDASTGGSEKVAAGDGSDRYRAGLQSDRGDEAPAEEAPVEDAPPADEPPAEEAPPAEDYPQDE